MVACHTACSALCFLTYLGALFLSVPRDLPHSEAVKYSIIWMNHNLFNQSSTKGHCYNFTICKQTFVLLNKFIFLPLCFISLRYHPLRFCYCTRGNQSISHLIFLFQCLLCVRVLFPPFTLIPIFILGSALELNIFNIQILLPWVPQLSLSLGFNNWTIMYLSVGLWVYPAWSSPSLEFTEHLRCAYSCFHQIWEVFYHYNYFFYPFPSSFSCWSSNES